MSAETDQHCGLVAVIGAPNAGKSTLINALVGSKVTIVSPKVQTTRSLVRGIALHDRAQVILVDTPGLFDPHKRLERAMVAAAWQSRDDADIVVLVVDVARKKIDRDTQSILRRLREGDLKTPCVLVMNKIDLLRPHELLPLAQKFNNEYPFAATFMISAEKNSGAQDLLRWLAGRLPQGPWLYPEDHLSDMPQRLLAAEITREKLFRQMHDEIPYGLTVETENWEPFEDGSVRISQVIYIARESHRPIILGKGGARIRSIGEAARLDMESCFDQRVHLSLFVKVKERWEDDPDHYSAWGLDFSA